MFFAAFVLLAGSVFPFLCATVPSGAEMPTHTHAHARVFEAPLLANPVTDPDCAELAPPQSSNERGLGFAASLVAWRNPVLAVEPLSPALPLMSNRDVSIRAMFQVYRL